MKVVLFTDDTSEYYIYPMEETGLPTTNAVIDIPQDLYERWASTRKAWRDVRHELEQHMHQAVYADEDRR